MKELRMIWIIAKVMTIQIERTFTFSAGKSCSIYTQTVNSKVQCLATAIEQAGLLGQSGPATAIQLGKAVGDHPHG